MKFNSCDCLDEAQVSRNSTVPVRVSCQHKRYFSNLVLTGVRYLSRTRWRLQRRRLRTVSRPRPPHCKSADWTRCPPDRSQSRCSPPRRYWWTWWCLHSSSDTVGLAMWRQRGRRLSLTSLFEISLTSSWLRTGEMLARLLVLPHPTANRSMLPSWDSWKPLGGRQAGLMWSVMREWGPACCGSVESGCVLCHGACREPHQGHVVCNALHVVFRVSHELCRIDDLPPTLGVVEVVGPQIGVRAYGSEHQHVSVLVLNQWWSTYWWVQWAAVRTHSVRGGQSR